MGWQIRIVYLNFNRTPHTLRVSPLPHNYKYHIPGYQNNKTQPYLISPIHPFLELFAHLEKRQLLRCNLDLITGFGIPAGVCPVFFDEKGTQTPDFNAIPLCQRLGHLVEKKGYDPFSFGSGQLVWIFQRLDQFDFVHSFEAPAVDWYGFDILCVGIAGRINLLAKLCQEINRLCFERADNTVKFFVGINGDCASFDSMDGSVKVLSEKTGSDENF